MITHILTLIRYSLLAYARNGALWQLCLFSVYLFAFSGFMTHLISRDDTTPQVEDVYIFLFLPTWTGIIIGTNMYGWWRRGFAMITYAPNFSMFRPAQALVLPLTVLLLAEFSVILGFVCFSRKPLHLLWQMQETLLWLFMLSGSIAAALCLYVYASLRKASPLPDSLMKSMFGSAWNRESTMMFFLVFSTAVGAGVPALSYVTLAEMYPYAWVLISCLWLCGLSCLLWVLLRTSTQYLFTQRFAMYKLLSRKV